MIKDYISKTKRILNICQGKHVLHIGCVGFADLNTPDRISLSKKSLHYSLSKCARTIGIDYSRDAIDYYLKNDIFDNVIYGNAENLQALGLASDFDVIVAGDIIEHLSNPGLMLDGIRSLSNINSLVIITTPHSFGLLSFIRHFFNRFKEGQEHVFTMNSLNMVNLSKRHGFEIIELSTCYQDNAIRSIFFNLGRVFFRNSRDWAERYSLSFD